MIDLSTSYLGLKLRNPLVASPSPLCEDIGNIRRMEDSGAGAVVLHSLFEEQIVLLAGQTATHSAQPVQSSGATCSVKRRSPNSRHLGFADLNSEGAPLTDAPS